MPRNRDERGTPVMLVTCRKGDEQVVNGFGELSQMRLHRPIAI